MLVYVALFSVQLLSRTYGPRSEGVTGSEGGGGRLIRVGADMVASTRVRCFH